jgi:hypothetical protein
MLKPTATFKMDKQTKRFMTTILDDHKRGEYKRAMIDAQLQSQVQYRPSKGKKD